MRYRLLAAFAFIITFCLIANAADEKPSAGAPEQKPHHDEIHDLKIGDAAPDFSLPGIDGKTHTLADYKDAKILIVAFVSNHCPDSHAAQPRIEKLLHEFKDKGVAVVGINPNNPDGLSTDELGFSKYNDSFDDMKKYAADTKMSFPYLYDGITQDVARAYGCLATPHVFIFDADRKLRYKGQLDDSQYPEESTVKKTPARDALEAMVSGKPVPVEATKPHGCSTKWISRKASIVAEMAAWDHKPVTLDTIDLAGVKKLRANGTKKLRLINVWATWCIPCRQEFPELVATSRRFAMRDFELITISVDESKNADKARQFLEKNGAGLPDNLKASLKAEGRATNSYQFSGGSPEDLMKELDPDWPGGIPHTILIAPDGSILWRHNGMVDGEELRGKVVDILGVYYKP